MVDPRASIAGVQVKGIVNLISGKITGAHTFKDGVIDSFFHSKNDVKFLFSFLKSLRGWLDSLVTIQHVEDAILCVSDQQD